MALCFIEPQDAIRVIAESIGREARRQLLGELVRAWVDDIPDSELETHYVKAIADLDEHDLSMLAAWHASLDLGQPIANRDFLVNAFSSLADDVQHLHFRYGPIVAAPGHNLILVGPVTIEKPSYDGCVTRIKPGFVRDDGTVPPVEQVHMHHAVFLNLSRKDATAPDTVPGERFYAFAEEKTTAQAPPGYGYFVKGSDTWAINY